MAAAKQSLSKELYFFKCRKIENIYYVEIVKLKVIIKLSVSP